MYKQSTQTAFAAVTLLAEHYDGGETRLSAPEIARRRGLQLPFLSKVLTDLVQAGLIETSRGPGGGFTLARSPSEIFLFDVFRLFEPERRLDRCPFGAGQCGVGEDCPLHDRFTGVLAEITGILQTTSLDEFRR